MSETMSIDQRLDAARARHGLVIGLAGWSGSGKTTLAEQLIAGLTARGLEIATIKHAHHGFDADKPGKDSYKREPIPKIEIFRLATGKPPLFTGDPQIIAVATDDAGALPAAAPHLLDLNDVNAIITYICEQAETGNIAAAS